MTTSREAKEELERILGQPVSAADPQWLRLMQNGVIVKLHIRRWRAKAALSLEDLGLPLAEDARAQRAAADLLTLGEKKLLPADLLKELESCESAGRKCLARFAFDSHWGAFVAVTAFDAWQRENDEHRQRYMALRGRILAEYDTLMAYLAAEYRTLAQEAYRRLMRLDDGPRTRQQYRDEEQFVRRFLDTIAGLIPTKEQIAASFEWSAELQFVPLPSMLEEDKAEADRLRTERQKREIQEEAERDALLLEIDLHNAALRDRQKKLLAMNDAVVEEARQKKQELVNGFLSDLVRQLRSMIGQTCEDVLGSMEKAGGKLGPRSTVALKNLIQNADRLNFFDDAEMTAAINRLRPLIAQDAEDRPIEEIQARLQDIAVVTRASLLALGEDVRKPRALSVPDDPPAALVRAARAGLGLAPTDAPDEPAPALSRPARVL